MAKKLLVFGATGQLAHEIGHLATFNDSLDITCLSRAEADFSAPDSLPMLLDRNRPDAVLIAAAYTAVDKAESEEAMATTINGEAPGVIARHCTRLGLPLLHVSTDYVFAGDKSGTYLEDDPVNPIGAYGRSKLAGEQAVQAECLEHVILRTAWVYSAHGSNFVKTMLRLGSDRDHLKIVADQYGIPTAAGDLAAACLDVTRQVLTYKRTDAWGSVLPMRYSIRLKHIGAVAPA
jgi:dTDP-4-dehydrorhamnose reductase